MKIFVQGLWHCGTVISASLAYLNHDVLAFDENKKTVNNLKRNKTPIYEPGLNLILKENIKKNKITFTNNLNKVNFAKVIWITYDTPVNSDDKAEISKITFKIKDTLKKTKSGKFIIVSSQLPVGTIRQLELYSQKVLKKKFHFLCCPENLRLGSAVNSFINSERLIIGYRHELARKKLTGFFKSISKNLLWMKIESAEMTKHAINSFLASSISFINEIALISEQTNANAYEVEEGLRSEPRIGRNAFISPGAPFSGGTLGRDLNYLNDISQKLKIKTNLINSINVSNKNHKKWVFGKLDQIIKKNKIRKVCLWGLTYTNNTDTLRRSYPIEIAKWLKDKDIDTYAYDSKVKSFPSEIKKIIKINKSIFSNLKKIDVLIINNKSEEFLKVSEKKIKKLNKKLIIIDPNFYCKQLNINNSDNYIYVGKNTLKTNTVKKKNKFKFNFKNKVVIITGASKGYGYNISRKFLIKGANIVICSRNLKDIKTAYSKLVRIKKKNQKILYFATDVSKISEVKNLINQTIKTFKKIDILINNAGIYGPKGKIEKINLDEFVKTININLLGSIYLCKEIIPHLKKNKQGKIIQLSGGGAASPLPFISAYAASKAAIVRFVENLSEELKSDKIDINAVAPGPLNTRMLDEVIKSGPKVVGESFYQKSLIQKKNGGTPFNEVDDLILFLASDYSNGISGKLISAIWDKWSDWVEYKKLLNSSDMYTLRRVTASDKGYDWGDK